jgi:hypothetical protein
MGSFYYKYQNTAVFILLSPSIIKEEKHCVTISYTNIGSFELFFGAFLVTSFGGINIKYQVLKKFVKKIIRNNIFTQVLFFS